MASDDASGRRHRVGCRRRPRLRGVSYRRRERLDRRHRGQRQRPTREVPGLKEVPRVELVTLLGDETLYRPPS